MPDELGHEIIPNWILGVLFFSYGAIALISFFDFFFIIPFHSKIKKSGWNCFLIPSGFSMVKEDAFYSSTLINFRAIFFLPFLSNKIVYIPGGK